jgi:hypothetical protein
MTSSRQQIANRNNARSSTGPKTFAGRMRAKRNAQPRDAVCQRVRLVPKCARRAIRILVGFNHPNCKRSCPTELRRLPHH